MDIKSFIDNYKNHPVLFIGTGFSLRYLNNSFTWEGLLRHIAYELTGSNEKFLDFKSNSQNDEGTYSYEKIATQLELEFNSTLSIDRNGKFKDINDIFYDNMDKSINISRFKIYISKLLLNLDLNSEKQDEIVSLKKVRKNIGSIITTNYDTLIETLFEFNPLIGNDILLSNPYGSVYKIHGCVTQPDKIIISDKDYETFDRKYELIRAQLLSLFIHNPVIFIGYSVNDENIRKILKTIFTYVPPNSTLAEKIKSNFLLIEHDEKSKNIEINEHDIVLEKDITIRVNKIKTDNFTEIYNCLASIQLPVSAMDIRKVQTIVKEIFQGGDIKVDIVDDINNLKNGEKVLAIGNINRLKYEYQTTGEMMENYFKIIEEDNFQLIQLIDKQRIQSTQFFPIFAFSRINSTLNSTDKLKQQQTEKIFSITIPTNYRLSRASLNDIMSDSTISSSGKHYSIIYNMLNNSLNLYDVERYLKDESDKQNTNFRRVLCVYDYLKYKD